MNWFTRPGVTCASEGQGGADLPEDLAQWTRRPGIVPGLFDGSARSLEANTQEDFLEGFSLCGGDHS